MATDVRRPQVRSVKIRASAEPRCSNLPATGDHHLCRTGNPLWTPLSTRLRVRGRRLRSCTTFERFKPLVGRFALLGVRLRRCPSG